MSPTGPSASLRTLAASVVVAVALAAWLAQLWLGHRGYVSPGGRAFAQASALAGVGLVMRRAVSGGMAVGLAWAATLALVALVWLPAAHRGAALGVLLVLVLAAGVEACAARWVRDADAAARATLALFALAATAPLWAGPVAEGAGAGVANLIIGVSPLSLLAVFAHHDYLREPWWYTHSPFGALRFDYPGAGPFGVAYAGISALLYAAAQAPGHLWRSKTR